MNLSKLRKDLLISLSGEIFSKIPLYLFEFLLASWLLVNEYAEWAVIVLFLRAGPYLHLGVLSFFNKRYPLLIGKESSARFLVDRVSNRIINSLILVYFAIAMLLFALGVINLTVLIVWCALCLLQLYSYFQAKVRCNGRFTLFVTGLLIFSMVQLVSAYYLVENLRVLGAAISVFCGYLCAIVYYLFIEKNSLQFTLIRRSDFKRVLRLGFAPFLLTISAFLLQVSDRISLIAVASVESLAFYNFYAIFFQLGITVVNSLGKVLGPYILIISGQSKVQNTLKLSEANVYFIVFCCLAFSFLFYFFGEIFLKNYYPQYSSGAIGVYNYSVSGFLLAIALIYYPQLIAIRKEKQVILLNLVFSILIISLVAILSMFYTNNLYFSLVSLIVNGLFSYILLSYIEKKLSVKLSWTKRMPLLILTGTLMVNLYVWN